MLEINSVLQNNKIIPERELNSEEKNTVIGMVFFDNKYKYYQHGEGILLNNKINELMGTNINNGIVDEVAGSL